MLGSSKVYVAGHGGLVGSAIVRALRARGYDNLLFRTRAELDLRDAVSVDRLFDDHRPEYVFLAAARVGGILANSTMPADFIRDNLLIQTNVIDAARKHGAKKLQFLGSSCIYPKHAPQPILEDYLLTGPLEPTNKAYAIAKIAGLTMVSAYRAQYAFNGISLMPTNLYGPGDNFDLATSHVLPALLRKMHDAKCAQQRHVVVWGSGNPRREFLHVDDLADAALFLMDTYDDDALVNVGVGVDITISALAEMIASVVGYKGDIVFDNTKPDGAPRKLLDVSRLTALGWRSRIPLRDGIASTYAWYLDRDKDTRPGFAHQ